MRIIGRFLWRLSCFNCFSTSKWKILKSLVLCAFLFSAIPYIERLEQRFETQVKTQHQNFTQTLPQSFLSTSAPSVQFLNGEAFKCNDSRALPSKKYAVIAASTPPPDKRRCILINAECSYAFYLPLTALAWQRLNFGIVVIIAGDPKPWQTEGTHLNYVIKTLLSPTIAAHIIFLPAEISVQTGIAQVGRLFVADMEPYSLQPDTYLVTSDTDLIPIKDMYSLPQEKSDIVLTNGRLSDRFRHGLYENIQMVALSSVGMRVSTWHSVMGYRQLSNQSNLVERIKESIVAEFGRLPLNATRGPYQEWFFDQELISYKLFRWEKDNGMSCRSYYGPGPVRWDRISWPMFQTEDGWLNSGKTDAHCPLPGHTFAAFKFFQPLAQFIAKSKLNVTQYWYNYVTLIDPGNNETLAEAGVPLSLEDAVKEIEDVQLQKPPGSQGLHRVESFFMPKPVNPPVKKLFPEINNMANKKSILGGMRQLMPTAPAAARNRKLPKSI